MATRAQSAVEPPDARTDHEFAVVAGLYVAALLAPAVLIAVAGSLGGPAASYVGLLGAGTVIAVVAGLLVVRTDGPGVRLGRHAATWLLILAPVPWFAGVLASVEIVGGPSTTAYPFAILGGIAGALLGFLLARMSRNRYTAARLTAAETFGQWEARWPRRWRRGALGIGIADSAIGLVALVVGYLYDVAVLGRFYVLLYAWAPLASVTTPRTYRITDVGLVLERPLARDLRAWSSIPGYTLTDDALVVRQTA